MEYLTNIFCENRYDLKTLEKVIHNFKNGTYNINNNNNSTTEKKNHLTLDTKNQSKNQIRNTKI